MLLRCKCMRVCKLCCKTNSETAACTTTKQRHTRVIVTENEAARINTVHPRDAAALSYFNRGFFLLALLAISLLAGNHVSRWLAPPENELLAIEQGDYIFAAGKLSTKAEDGNLQSQTTLANLYRFGLGVEQDLQRAARLYSASARAGDDAAMVNLGLMYREGLGVTQNGELAYAWFNLARESGNQVGQLYMSELIASFEIRGHRVPDIRRSYSTINNLPDLPPPQSPPPQ